MTAPAVITSLYQDRKVRVPGITARFGRGALLGASGPPTRGINKPNFNPSFIKAEANKRLALYGAKFTVGGKRKPPPPGDTTPPKISVNAGMVAPIGHTTAFSSTMLSVVDPDNAASQLTYTVTKLPVYGTLNLTTFTQATVNGGGVTYTAGSTVGSDVFSFTVSDPAGNKTTGGFAISVVSTTDVPTSKDWMSTLFAAFGSTDVSSILPIDGNDVHNDCVIAMFAHGLTMSRAAIGLQDVPAASTCLNLYFLLTGGADNGLNYNATAQYIYQNGLFGDDSWLGWVQTSCANLAHIKKAVDLFPGGANLGFYLPTNYQTYFNNRWPWIPGTSTGEGHGVLLTGYDDNATFTDPNTNHVYTGLFNCATWGTTQLITYDCVQQMGQEVVSNVWVDANNRAWDGLDTSTIMSALTSVAN